MSNLISKTADMMKAKFTGEGSGHDWWHIYRVWKLAKSISEGEEADTEVVELGALLHDIADYKFHDGDDPEYKQGEELEEEYFVIEDKKKTFLSVDSTRSFFRRFDTILLDNFGETYKDSEKGIHNLIRFVGQKANYSGKNQLALPFVGAIIERENGNGELEILMQTRWKPNRDPVYSGTLEFPAGVLDKGYEEVYEALKREINEETGLELLEVIEGSKTEVYKPQGDDASFGFRPFCCVQQLENGRPWIGFIFRCKVKPGEPKAQQEEVRDIKWMKISEIKELFENNPEKLFTLEISVWEYYFKEVFTD